MTKQEMMERRMQQDKTASQSRHYRKQKVAHDIIEDRNRMKDIPLCDEDYFEQLWNEVA